MYQYRQWDAAGGVAPQFASLGEILCAFSYALDLTEGQPEGHSLRSCWMGTRLARAIGLPGAQLSDVYFTVLMKDLGCSSNAARVAEIYSADDRLLKQGFKLVDGSVGQTLKFVLENTAPGAGWLRRAQAIGNIVRNGQSLVHELIQTRCTRGADIARQLRLSETVAEGIAHLDEHWNGSGKPRGISGTAIPIGSRIALLAQVADVYFAAAGPDAARAEVQRRSGSWLDPELVAAFLKLSAAPEFWLGLAGDDIEQRVLALEPASGLVMVDEDYLDAIVAAFGQVIDAKSPYTSGHSDRVGQYCDLVAAELGYDEAARRALRRAAMLHDVGKLGVSSTILEKPGKLEADEWHVMQSHATHTLRILQRVGVLSGMASIAAAHHERLDGKGYPHNLDATMISMDTRIITVCDFFDALTADRPYRAAMPVEKALDIIGSEVDVAIDPRCFAALKAVVAGGVPQQPLPEVDRLQ